MPCNDVTELMTLQLDQDERLVDYQFTKRSCGRGIGEAGLLTNQIAGKSVDEIRAISPLEFAADAEDLEEFLALKHLIAIQTTLGVYIGEEPCGPAEMCTASNITYDETGTIINARILVDLVTDAIQACGRCAGCRTTR